MCKLQQTDGCCVAEAGGQSAGSSKQAGHQCCHQTEYYIGDNEPNTSSLFPTHCFLLSSGLGSTTILFFLREELNREQFYFVLHVLCRMIFQASSFSS